MRCRGADIDPDTGEAKSLLFLHVTVGIGERTSRCGGHWSPWTGFELGFRLYLRRRGDRPVAPTRTINSFLVGVLVEFRFHARLRADACERFFELFTEIRIFFVVRNRRAAVFHIDGAVVDALFTGLAAIASRRVWTEPRG